MCTLKRNKRICIFSPTGFLGAAEENDTDDNDNEDEETTETDADTIVLEPDEEHTPATTALTNSSLFLRTVSEQFLF